MNINLINGDCLEKMKEIQDNYINLTITSPPYDNLREYKGHISNWNEDKWKIIIKELYRITNNGGVVVWVVNDETKNGSESGTSFKQALWAKECGFNLYDTMIYKKKGISYPSQIRYYQCFEYMFIWSKGNPKTINLISDRKNVKFGKNLYVNYSNRRMGDLIKQKKKIVSCKEFGVRFNIWEYSTGYNSAYKEKYVKEHPAVFPEKLAHDHVISWSNENDIVFDPFMGSGTVGLVCKKTNRNFIGIEIEKKYFDISKKRINEYIESENNNKNNNLEALYD